MQLHEVSGVQTCALRIFEAGLDQPFKRAIFPFGGLRMVEAGLKASGFEADPQVHEAFTKYRKSHNDGVFDAYRSEERRVGKESRSRWSPDHLKKKKMSI